MALLGRKLNDTAPHDNGIEMRTRPLEHLTRTDIVLIPAIYYYPGDAKLTFPVNNAQTSRSWRTGDAISQGPVLSMNSSCAKLDLDQQFIRWMSFDHSSGFRPRWGARIGNGFRLSRTLHVAQHLELEPGLRAQPHRAAGRTRGEPRNQAPLPQSARSLGPCSTQLVTIKPRYASEEELARVHSREHIARIKAMSAENGGDASVAHALRQGAASRSPSLPPAAPWRPATR